MPIRVVAAMSTGTIASIVTIGIVAVLIDKCRNISSKSNPSNTLKNFSKLFLCYGKNGFDGKRGGSGEFGGDVNHAEDFIEFD